MQRALHDLEVLNDMQFFKRLYIGMLITNAAMYAVFVASMFYYIHSNDGVFSVFDVATYSGFEAYAYGLLTISLCYICGPGTVMTNITVVSFIMYKLIKRNRMLGWCDR